MVTMMPTKWALNGDDRWKKISTTNRPLWAVFYLVIKGCGLVLKCVTIQTLMRGRIMNTRNTNRQQEVLQLLSGCDFYQEVGAQPYTASSIAWLIDSSADQNQLTTSVRRTLQLLVKKGLVRAEKIPVEVQTGVSVAHRNLDHYWNIATEKEDMVTAKAWNDGKKKRSDNALDKMFK